MPLVEVNNLKTWFPVRGSWFFQPKLHLRAVDGVSFTIEKGETLGLVGESGCGKTTLGRTMVRLENATDGEVLIDGVDVLALSGRRLRRYRRNMQIIFQDPYGSLNPRMTVFKILDEVLAIHSSLNAAGRMERISALMDDVGLRPEHAHRYPHQFSGGQRQRIGIARALAVEPKLIIADEPVSALDVSVQAQIINLLKEIQSRTGIAYLFIAHDLAVVENISGRIMVMYLGKIVELGAGSTVCSRPAHPYTRALVSAVPTLDPETRRERIILPGDVPSPLDPPTGCPFHPRCPMVSAKCRREIPELRKVKGEDDRWSACFFAEQVQERLGREKKKAVNPGT